MELAIHHVIAVTMCLSIGPSPQDQQAPETPTARTHYMGREIAPAMGHQGAAWLTRESREREEAAERMLQALEVKPGAAVGDIGCGNGFHTLRLARMVGESGRVYAVDIQPEMLQYLKAAAAEQPQADRIETVLGSLTSPNLDVGCLDLALLVDVYHEFSHPERMLRALRRSLKPDGHLVLVEFRLEDPDVPIKTLHKMSKVQMRRELEANGFRVARDFNDLPWQHMMFFAADPAWMPTPATPPVLDHE